MVPLDFAKSGIRKEISLETKAAGLRGAACTAWIVSLAALFQASFTLPSQMESPHSNAMLMASFLLFSVHYRTAMTVQQAHFSLARQPARELGLQGCPSPGTTLQPITASFLRAVF